MPTSTTTDTIRGTATPIVSPPSSTAAEPTAVTSDTIENSLLKLTSDYYQTFDYGTPDDPSNLGLFSKHPKSAAVTALLKQKTTCFNESQEAITRIVHADFNQYRSIVTSTDYQQALLQHSNSAQKVADNIRNSHRKFRGSLQTLHHRQLDELEILCKTDGKFKTLKDDSGNVVVSEREMENFFHNTRNNLLQLQHKQLEKIDQLWEKRRQTFVSNYQRAEKMKTLVNAHNADAALKGQHERISFSRSPDHFMGGDIPSDFENTWYKEHNFFENEQLRQQYARGGALLFECGTTAKHDILPGKKTIYAQLMINVTDKNNIKMTMEFPGRATPDEKRRAFCAAIPRMIGNGMDAFDLTKLPHWGENNIKTIVKEILKHDPRADIKLPLSLQNKIDLEALRLDAEQTTHPAWRKKNGLGDRQGFHSAEIKTPPPPPNQKPIQRSGGDPTPPQVHARFHPTSSTNSGPPPDLHIRRRGSAP
jgi:hypothetical protein